jgi:hypothetical protein
MLNIFKSFNKNGSDDDVYDDTCLASQKVLSNMSNRFDGRIPVRIFFLDNSSKLFLLDKSITVRDLILIILEKLYVNNPNPRDILQYFGLYIAEDGVNINEPLSLDDEIVLFLTEKNKSNDNIDKLKVVFMIRLYLPSLWGLDIGKDNYNIIDESLIYLQYIQAVYNVITGQYVVTIQEAVKLGAIHFILKLGFFNKLVHEVGYIGNRIVEFIPVKLMKTKSINEWEQLLLDSVYNISNEIMTDPKIKDNSSNSNIMAKYLTIILNMDFYGQTFFKCSQHTIRSLPEKPILGIHIEGINIYDKMKKLLVSYSLMDIIRWGFKPNVHFYFEIDPEKRYYYYIYIMLFIIYYLLFIIIIIISGGILQPSEKGIFFFETIDGQHIADLLSDYAQAFILEEERVEQETMKIEQSKQKKRISFAEDNMNSINTKKEDNKNLKTNKNNAIQSPIISPSNQSNNSNKQVRRKSKFNIFTAVIAIQALYRGYALRRDWIREDAAIFIQSIYRGHRARVRVSKIIEILLNG